MDKSDRIIAEIKKRREGSEIRAAEQEKRLLVIFKLCGDYYAFFGDDVKEVLPLEKIAYVPGCPEFISGIINVRGDIESVLNIHNLMGLEGYPTSREVRIIIAEKEGIRSGILVDSVEDVIEVSPALIKETIPTIDKSIREFIIGGEKLYGNEYVSILDIGKVFSAVVPEKSLINMERA